MDKKDFLDWDTSEEKVAYLIRKSKKIQREILDLIKQRMEK